jgi:hypothetical protein
VKRLGIDDLCRRKGRSIVLNPCSLVTCISTAAHFMVTKNVKYGVMSVTHEKAE